MLRLNITPKLIKNNLLSLMICMLKYFNWNEKKMIGHLLLFNLLLCKMIHYILLDSNLLNLLSFLIWSIKLKLLLDNPIIFTWLLKKYFVWKVIGEIKTKCLWLLLINFMKMDSNKWKFKLLLMGLNYPLTKI